MHDQRDDYEPIIATRRSREPQREDTQPLWRIVLALIGGVAVVVLLAWWWMGRSSTDVASSSAESEGAAPEMPPEIHVEQEVLPQARDADAHPNIPQAPAPQTPADEPDADAEQLAVPKDIPEVTPDNEVEPAAPPAPTPVSVRFTSPDPQVRVELYRPLETSPVATSKVGDVIDVEPGRYRVVASGAQLETFEQEVTFDGKRPLEYTVELCAERKYERESLAGQVVEERTCTSTEECESMFMILGDYADELVKDRAFRTQECAKWRPNAAPDGSWTLHINCDGATPATTCSVVIAEGACTHAEPRRSARGTACPRGEIS